MVFSFSNLNIIYIKLHIYPYNLFEKRILNFDRGKFA